MKVFTLLPLAALGTAFVLPDQEVMGSAAVQNTKSNFEQTVESIDGAWQDFEDSIIEKAGCAKHMFDDAVEQASEKVSGFGKDFTEAFDYQSWLESAEETLDEFSRPPKHPHKRPHHPPHHHKPNQTVYELIAKSKYTTVLAKLINDYPDLVELLNGTAANYTVFAPTDKAFEKVPKHAPKPSKDDLKKILTYHVSPDFYPAGRVLVSRTIPTLLKASAIGDEPQRLSAQISFKGLTLDFYSRIVAVNIFGTNGVIHGVDSILVPPPKVIDILKFLPGEFSTLDLALYKTGFAEKMNDTSTHVGGTLFAPSNDAFKRLGTRIVAFLFSDHGEKYLKALLEYHIVPNFTLYSDAFYKGEEAEVESGHRIPKGRYHIDLPTALEDKSLAIDIARFGRLIEIKINGYNRVAIPDGIAKDGVIHVINTVLIPPKKPGLLAESEEELSIEELKERLDPYVDNSEEWSVDL